jgi:hypothetical protein
MRARLPASTMMVFDDSSGRADLKHNLEASLSDAFVPKPEEVASSFDQSLPVRKVVFTHAMRMLRLFGGDSTAVGRYLFCCLVEAPHGAPESVSTATGRFSHWVDGSGLALPPGNQQQDLAVIDLPPSTVAYVGSVADNFGRPGGNVQVFVPTLPKSVRYEAYRAVKGEGDPSDIAVLFDNDRVVRFARVTTRNAEQPARP